MEYEANKVGGTNWYDQITAALYVDGDAEAQAEAGPADWVLHVTDACLQDGDDSLSLQEYLSHGNVSFVDCAPSLFRIT